MREAAQTRETSMNQPSDKAPGNEPGNLPDELRAEAARLRKLADELQARERKHQEMLANYPHFKQAVYAWLREKFEREGSVLATRQRPQNRSRGVGRHASRNFPCPAGLL